MYTHHSIHQRTTYGSRFSPPIMWVQEIEFLSSGLVTNALTRRAISPRLISLCEGLLCPSKSSWSVGITCLALNQSPVWKTGIDWFGPLVSLVEFQNFIFSHTAAPSFLVTVFKGSVLVFLPFLSLQITHRLGRMGSFTTS